MVGCVGSDRRSCDAAMSNGLCVTKLQWRPVVSREGPAKMMDGPHGGDHQHFSIVSGVFRVRTCLAVFRVRESFGDVLCNFCCLNPFGNLRVTFEKFESNCRPLCLIELSPVNF